MLTKYFQSVVFLLSDARGVYIPANFVECFDLSTWQGLENINLDDLSEPENGCYWDTWQDVLSNASYTDDKGNVFTLYQDGNLWAICFEKMTNEEKENFGFELDCEEE
jgi:hypothetical protein